MTEVITPEAEGAWVKRSTVSPEPVQLANYKRYIPSFLIPALFESQFVAVGIRVTASGENWRFGGFLAQEFGFDSSGYREANRAFFRTEELLINNVTVLKLPVATGEPYRLRFFPPTWFRDLTLEIWEYTGLVIDGGGGTSPDISQQLEEIKNLVSVGFIDLNNRLDREDVPAKLTDISIRLERIEQQLGLGNLPLQLSTSTSAGRLFFFS
ncbi:MAG: hypothetical protein AAFQ41_03100 [Cyanobacteria bacterium J06623_7]